MLLPKCLRSQDRCEADMDEFGLVCSHCGRCLISELQTQAEQLGYAVLVAEGSPVVMSLVETGKIEAVIGVSCLSVLKGVFSYVDADWVWDAIYVSGDDQTPRLNLGDLRRQANNLFLRESLQSLLSPAESQTEELAQEWLAKAGKRWRPFLTACTYQALTESSEGYFPEDLRAAAVAVECFHKASLIHDDIEDGDIFRYGEKTLHAEFGIPIALNVGDFLLGEGYRLLAELEASNDCRIKMLCAAAWGHRNLCLGQGDELSWIRQPRPLSVAEVVDIFQKKTSPAFEVALSFGAILAGCSDELSKALKQYSRSLGIAYQIRDDIDDFNSGSKSNTPNEMRPSLLLAMAYELADGVEKKLLESVWKRSVKLDCITSRIEKIFVKLGVARSALDLMESYKAQAISSLAVLNNANLKSLLRRVVGRIFNDVEVMGCCNDYKAGHAGGGEPGKASAG